MNTSEIDTTNNAPAPRRWLRRSLITALLVVAAGLAWWLLAGNTDGVTVTAQPAGAAQSTAQQSDTRTGNGRAAALLTAVLPVTATVDTVGQAARPAPPVGGMPPAGGMPAPSGAAAAAAVTTASMAVTIDAVAGLDGVSLQALNGSAPVTVATGARLTLVGRSADNLWLLAAHADATGWAPAAAVIAFNTGRLPVAATAPPAQPATTVADTGADETTAATAGEVATSRAASATDAGATDAGATAAADTEAVVAATATAALPEVTVRIDTARTRGLNVRSGPSSSYARLAALAADDVATVVGRTADGGWLELDLGDGMTGWASAYYLAVDGAIDSLPVTVPATITATITGDAASTATPISQSLSRSIAQADASGLSGTLVFQSEQGGAIYAYDLDSGALRQLTTGFDPALSPDGQTVAFTRQGVDSGLYLIDVAGGSERRIYSGPRNLASPKWREDGSAIVFSYAVSSMECRDMGGGRCVPDADFQGRMLADVDPNDYPLITQYEYDLGVVAADGSNFHSLSALPSSRAPDWTAAGIVYQSSDGIQTIQDAPGASSQVVTYDMLQPAYQDPDWQPGGGRILFQKQGASHWEIWAVDATGANMVALTQPQTVLVDALPSNVAPAWSPDGSQIVFLSNRTVDGAAGAWHLWVMDADGSNQQQLPIDVELNYTFGAEQVVSWGG